MKFILVLVLIFFLQCSYQIVNEVDEYNRLTRTYEKMNRVQNFAGSMYLNLFKVASETGTSVYIKYECRQQDWLFIEQSNSFQFLFMNDDVLNLSINGISNREVSSGGGYVGIIEWGLISLDKVTLQKLLNQNIKSLRVNGSSYYNEYKTGFLKVQERWREFSKSNLNEFLNN